MFVAFMEVLRFVSSNDPILESLSRPLTIHEIQEPKMQQLFDCMLYFAAGEQGDQQKSILVGLAAPQIGKNIRVILVDLKADGKGQTSDLHLYINPEIIEISDETEVWYEGCYSTGDVKAIVKRPSRIKIRALDRKGKEVFESHKGYVARIFQHEIDHLNGIRFPERVESGETLHIVKESEMHQYRNNGAWRDWKVTIPKSDWKKYLKS